MTRKLEDKLNLKRAAFPRALSILLLAFIICGTTVEAAHNHGNLAESNKVTATHFSDPATESKAGTSSPGCSECLICQLHQHFSATVLAVPPSIIPASIRSRFFDFTTVSVHSQISRPRAGRAPPQISL